MSDHLPETALDDRKYGEEFWSAAEEFCSCQSDEEDGGNTEFCTYSDYEYFSVGSPLHPKKDAESGGPIKNADFQYDLQLSTGSGDEKTGHDKSGSSNVRCAEQDEGPVRQGTPQSHVSITESECDSQSTGSHVTKDSIKSVVSKCVEEGTSKEGGKYTSVGSRHMRKSSKNRTGKRNSGVNTSRVGLVIGNRQLASVLGSAPSIMTDVVVGSSPSIMNDAVVGSSPSCMTDAVIGSSPSCMTDAVIGSAPSSVTDAVVGSAPSSMTDAVVCSSPSSMTDAVVGSSPSIMNDAVVGLAPSSMTDAVVGSSPSCMADAVRVSSPSSMTHAVVGSAPSSMTDVVVGSSPSSMTHAVVGSAHSSMSDAVIRSSSSTMTDAVVGSSPPSMTDAVIGSSPSSITDHDDQSVFPDQQKHKSYVESKYQQRGHGKRAEKILGVHAHRAPKQSEYLLGDETTAKYLSRKHQKTSKKTAIKGQEKSRDNGQENNVRESSRDQSDARTFLREEVSQSDLPTNHLRDIDGPPKSYYVASKSQNAQETESGYNPCKLKDETEDQMILVVSTSPEVSESMEDKDDQVSFSIQRHTNNETYEADSERKEKQQNLKNANQYSKETVDEEAESLSQHVRKGGKNTDADGKEELLCNNCLKRLQGSSCDDFPRDELPQNDISSDHSKNGYTIRGQFFEPAKQDARINLDDSGKSCKQFQGNNHDKMTSLQLSVPAPSHLIAGRERSEVDATYTTKDSFSVRVNKHDKEKNSDTNGKESPRDNGKHDYVHSAKHPQGPGCEENNRNSYQREDVSENKLHINKSKNNDVKQNHRLIKGANPNFERKQDGKRHALSHQTRTEKADIKGKDELIGNRTEDVVHRFEYLNRSSCDQNGGTSSRREFTKNDLKTNFLRYDEEKGSDLLIQTKRISRGKLDDSDTPCKQLQRKSIDEFPSEQFRTQELSYPISDVGKTETNSTLNSTMKPKGPVVVQGDIQGTQYLEYPHKASQSGWKGFPRNESSLNDRRTNLKKGDEASTPPLIRTNQKIEGKFDNDTHVFLTYPRRTKKPGSIRPQGRAPQTDLPTISRNDEDSTLPTIRTNRNCNGILDDTDDSCDECQLKNETDLATSIRSSSQEDAKTGMNNAKMDTTFAAEASFSIRGNKVLSAGSHKKYFYDMWMIGKLCDVNIVVDDHAFLAHRVILAANSEYFEKIFLDTPVKTDLLTVYISDMSADLFRNILRYMYTGDIDIQFSHVSQLLRGSLFLSIKSLTNALQTFLLNTWKGECIGAFCLAQTAGLHDLHKEILNYIRTHFVEVSTSEHFALCPVEHASCILTDDNLWINEETDILYAVLLWLEHHTRDISSNLRLLRHVRFEYIPLETIERIEKSHLNSISNESVRRYIQDARKRASCLKVDQLHFDPPIIRQRIAEVVGCRTSRTIDSESITAKNSGHFYETSDKEEHISSSKEEQTSSYSQGDRSVSPIQKSPSSTKSSKSLITKAGPFPSYHDIDTTPIRVSVSQDVSASPVASNDDLGERSSQEAEEDETTVQIVRIGGISRTWNEDCVNSDIEKLERRRGKRWEQWTSFAELPVAMHHQAACFIHNSIYISGGHVQLPCDASCNHFQPSRLFHVYDLMKAKWYRLADLEQARVFHQMVALFGQIYVIGGQGHNGGALAAVDRYSPYTDSWRQVAPLSSPRYAVAAAAYNFHLWVAGGATNHVTNHVTSQNADEDQESGDENDASVYDGFYKSSSTLLTGVVECYSPHDNSWTKIKGLPTPRCHASLLRIKKRLFLVGGFSCIRHFPDDDSSTSSVDVYDDITESWRYVTDVGEGNYGANTVAAGSKIVILGKPGPFLESDGDVISIFDTSTDKWELRRSLLLESRVGHACCAIPVSLHSPLRRT